MKSFRFYSNDQWLLYREQTWFNIADIFHALMLNWNSIDVKILITLRNWSLKGEVKSLMNFLIFGGS
jgi:hypothetical protein